MQFKVNALIAISASLIGLSSNAATLEAGQDFQDSIPIALSNNRDIFSTMPLPEGQWTVAVTTATPGRDNKNTFRNIVLYQADRGNMTQAAEYRIKVEGQSTRWSDEPCKVTAPLYKNDYGTRLWQQKCLTIQESPFLQNNNASSQKSLELMGSRGVKPEFNAISISYTRYGDGDKYTTVRLFIVPSTYGFENPVTNVSSASPWAAHNISSDLEKSKFLDAIKAYAESIVVGLDKAYETGSATMPLKRFTYENSATRVATGAASPVTPVTSAAPAPENDSKGKMANTELRLLKLKSVYEQGLITKVEYDAQRVKILELL